MGKKVDVDKLLEELEKRKQEVFQHKSKAIETPTTLKNGAVLGINDAIVLIKKLTKEDVVDS